MPHVEEREFTFQRGRVRTAANRSRSSEDEVTLVVERTLAATD